MAVDIECPNFVIFVYELLVRFESSSRRCIGFWVCPSLTCSRKQHQVLKNGSVPLWKCQETPTELNPSAKVIFTLWKETNFNLETFSFSRTKRCTKCNIRVTLGIVCYCHLDRFLSYDRSTASYKSGLSTEHGLSYSFQYPLSFP